MSGADHYAFGDYNAVCYDCGRKFKASMLRKNWQGFWECPVHWTPRQPQDFVRSIPDTQTAPWAQPQVFAAASDAQLVYEATGTRNSNGTITLAAIGYALAVDTRLTVQPSNEEMIGPYPVLSAIAADDTPTLTQVVNAGTQYAWSVA